MARIFLPSTAYSLDISLLVFDGNNNITPTVLFPLPSQNGLQRTRASLSARLAYASYISCLLGGRIGKGEDLRGRFARASSLITAPARSMAGCLRANNSQEVKWWGLSNIFHIHISNVISCSLSILSNRSGPVDRLFI